VADGRVRCDVCHVLPRALAVCRNGVHATGLHLAAQFRAALFPAVRS
jgi:hypothetical protein